MVICDCVSGFAGVRNKPTGANVIELWKQAVVESAAFYVGWGGLLIGVVFGFVVYKINFCTMGW